MHSDLAESRLSVVIPVRNGAAFLDRCLTALSESSVQPFETLVVDDGSMDGSRRIAEAAGARVIPLGGTNGPAAARNRGAVEASGELLLFLDADVMVHRDTLGRIVHHFQSGTHPDALIGSYDDAPAGTGVASRYKNLLHHYVHQHGRREAETFWTGCGAIRRGVFLESGGFDESFRRPCIEDIQLGVRLRAAGRRIELHPDVQAKHLKEYSLRTLLRSDIFDRALPWTRLILGSGRMPNDLNLRRVQRASAGLVLLFLVLLVFWSAWAPLPLAGAIWLNRDFYRFLARAAGRKVAVAGALLHLAYYVYSSVAFGAGVLLYLLVDRRHPGADLATGGSLSNPVETR